MALHSFYFVFISIFVPVLSNYMIDVLPCVIFCQNKSEVCLKECDKLAHNLQTTDAQFQQSFDIRLVCREDNMLVTQWNNIMDIGLIYFVEVQSEYDDLWMFVNITEETISIVSNLESDTGYNIRVTGLCKEGKDCLAISTKMFRTLKYNVNPSAVEEINISNITHVGQTVKATLSWTPVPERTCRYDIVVWNPSTSDTRQLSLEYDEFYSVELTGLEFHSFYSIAIYSVTNKNDSTFFWSNFTTPSCFELSSHKNECIPEPPVSLKINTFEDECKIIVSWEKPIFPPENYLIEISNEFGENEYNATSFGNETEATISTLGLNNKFVISVTAVSAIGNSAPSRDSATNMCKINYNSTDVANLRSYLNWKARLFAISLGSITIGAMTLLGLCYCIFYNRKKSETHQTDKLKISIVSTTNTKSFYNDKGKIEDGKIISSGVLCLNHILGEGEYGVVHKATLTMKGGFSKEVAAKVLRANATSDDKMLLEKEIKVMNTIGSHRNIVGLLGYNKMQGMLIMEYCGLGDLQRFLKQIQKDISQEKKFTLNYHGVQQMSKNNCGYYGTLFTDTYCETKVALNPLYCKTGMKKNELPQMRMIDLLSFARQVAVGMKYLSENRIVHRDLAARNVLVCEDLTVKISDFGLSRDIYEENIYVKKTKSRLPIKWMAIESMMHQVFTVQSDVWSFGILLWEIMTLGGSPYPLIPSERILNFLQGGNRLEKPDRCNKEIYNIMMSCWEVKPYNRPTFSTLVDMVDTIMSAASPQQYLELEAENIL